MFPEDRGKAMDDHGTAADVPGYNTIPLRFIPDLVFILDHPGSCNS